MRRGRGRAQGLAAAAGGRAEPLLRGRRWLPLHAWLHQSMNSLPAGVGYTDEDNPFGDANLTERFVWGKKIEREIGKGRDVRDLTAAAESRRQAERLVRGRERQGRGWRPLLARCCPAPSFEEAR